MKTLLSKSIAALLVTLILNACTGYLPYQPDTPAAFTPLPSPVPASASKTTDYKLISPADMRSDLDELFRQIEEAHPNPYAQRSKEDVDRDRLALYEELGQPMTVVDFYKELAPLLASLGDGHTRVLPPSDTFNQIYGHEKLFPLQLEFEGGQAFILSDPTGNSNIQLGAVLLTINGTGLSDILPNLVSDPRLPFAWRLWILCGSSPEYQITFLPPNQTTPVSLIIPGLTLEEMDKGSAAAETWEEVTYNTLPQRQTGILTVNGFGNIKEPLQQAFHQIQKDHVNHLIIDIRANDGGYLESLQFLMDYLTEGPYQKCSQCAWIKPADVADRYHGQLYLLIGPDTMSTAVAFATILQDQGLATLVGEETIESSSFCANIIPAGQALPKTKLRYTVSYTCYVRPNGVVTDRGVIPDMIVETTINDRITGNDPVLHYTLEMIRASK